MGKIVEGSPYEKNQVFQEIYFEEGSNFFGWRIVDTMATELAE